MTRTSLLVSVCGNYNMQIFEGATVGGERCRHSAAAYILARERVIPTLLPQNFRFTLPPARLISLLCFLFQATALDRRSTGSGAPASPADRQTTQNRSLDDRVGVERAG